MKSEMSYKFKGSGFDAPEEKKKYEQPDLKLSTKFEKLLENMIEIEKKHRMDSDEKKAEAHIETDRLIQRFIKENKIGLPEGHGIILKYQDNKRQDCITYFLSRLHNQCDDKAIIYDLDTDIELVGADLPAGKCLVNKSNAQYIGEASKGNIINYAEAEDVGNYSSGIVINAGKARFFGSGSKGLLINFGDAEMFAVTDSDSSCKMINAGTTSDSIYLVKTEKIIDYTRLSNAVIMQLPGPVVVDKKTKLCIKTQIVTNPEFNKFIEDLRQKVEAGRNDNKEAVKLANSLDQEIKDLDQIMKEAGHEWWFK